MNIHKSAAGYEAWLRVQLQGEVVEKDLQKKHEKMCESSFVFLRGTYWRWAEQIPALCPELAGAPVLLAIGDIHVENFGTWRDLDGRLVWGVNDFDEVATMPYALDLLRLAVSAYLGQDAKRRNDLPSICASVLKGYQAGLDAPGPFILDKDNADMRRKFVASEDDRQAFWSKMVPKGDAASMPPRFRTSLLAAMPEGAQPPQFWPRAAGVGSLGRPRWVAMAQWKGAPVVREAKAIVPSGWYYARQPGNLGIQIESAVDGPYRAPDPWYQLSKHNVAVRRLSPNNHKIEMEAMGQWLFDHHLLEQMGHEIANIHLGSMDVLPKIRADLAGRHGQWLADLAARAVRSCEEDFEDWRKG